MTTIPLPTSVPVRDTIEARPESDNYLTHTRGVLSWIFTLDHKRIGVMYMWAVLGSFLLGGIFALLALTSLLYLLRNHSLRSKQLGGWFSFLPSIMDLDQIGRRLLGAGVAILTASLAIISIFWLRNPGSAAAVKILFTVAVWAVATVTLVLRLRGALIAKRFAWSCLILFLAALLSLAVVDRTRKPAPASREVRAS